MCLHLVCRSVALAVFDRGRCFARGGRWRQAFRLLAGVFLLSQHFTLAGAEPEKDIVPELPSLWDVSGNVRGEFGYKDNLLLSSFNREGSVLWKSSADFSLLRFPVDGNQFTVFMTAEDTEYPQGRSVHDEQLFMLLMDYLYRGEQWQAGVTMQEIYQNQVFDTSSIEALPRTVRALGDGVKLRLRVRRLLSDTWWLEAGTSLQRQYFQQPLDNDWETGGSLALGRSHGRLSEITLTQEVAERTYDTRPPLDRTGGILNGTALSFFRTESVLAWKQRWGEGARWTLTTKAGVMRNVDNGSGYFDYWRFRAGAQLSYAVRTWEIKAGAHWNEYRYDVQTVALTDARKVSRDDVSLEARLEVPVRPKLRWFVSYEADHSLANQSAIEYHVNTVSTGLDWEF